MCKNDDRFTQYTSKALTVPYLSRSGPNPDKKCVRLSEVAASHERLIKIYFAIKPFKKGLNSGW